VRKVFDSYLKTDQLGDVVAYFQDGWGVEISDTMGAEEYVEGVRSIPGLRRALEVLGAPESPGLLAAATEFVLEGLHLHQKLNKERTSGRHTYRA
jgi:magnesium chelatase subunit I